MRALFMVLLLLAGCAGTQTQQAFTPQRAAVVVPFAMTPNVSAEHASSLEEALDRSLRAQEQEDERADFVSSAPALAVTPAPALAATPAPAPVAAPAGVTASKLAGLGP